jgi:hypothetical protein
MLSLDENRGLNNAGGGMQVVHRGGENLLGFWMTCHHCIPKKDLSVNNQSKARQGIPNPKGIQCVILMA